MSLPPFLAWTDVPNLEALVFCCAASGLVAAPSADLVPSTDGFGRLWRGRSLGPRHLPSGRRRTRVCSACGVARILVMRYRRARGPATTSLGNRGPADRHPDTSARGVRTRRRHWRTFCDGENFRRLASPWARYWHAFKTFSVRSPGSSRRPLVSSTAPRPSS